MVLIGMAVGVQSTKECYLCPRPTPGGGVVRRSTGSSGHSR